MSIHDQLQSEITRVDGVLTTLNNPDNDYILIAEITEALSEAREALRSEEPDMMRRSIDVLSRF